MNLDPLFEAIANCAVFLETASNDVLDPDEAVNQQEELMVSLLKADQDTRQALVASFRRLATQESDPIRRRALEELPIGLGLIEEE